MNKIWDSLKNLWLTHWQDIVTFVAVLVLGYIVIKIVAAIFKKVLRRSKLDNAAGGFILIVIKIFLYLAYIIALLSLIGIPTTSLIALLSAFGLAISLAMQSTLSNFANGMIIIATKPFVEGDFVEINGVSGVIDSIHIFHTKLLTTDNKQITIPNSLIVNDNLINYTTQYTRRVELPFSVAYGSDVDKVKYTIMRVLGEYDLILPDPAPFVGLKELGASSLNFVVRVWVKNTDYWTTYFDLNEKILAALIHENIEIPFNQLDVHIKNQEQ